MAEQKVQGRKIELDQALAERTAILQDVTKRIKKILASGGLGAALRMAKNGQFTQLTWAQALLVAMRLPVTADNIAAITAWEMAEGGHWYNTAYYNPLNTTQDMPGATVFNSVGVKAYTSWKQGLEATVKTLKNGYYGGIIDALKRATTLRPWPRRSAPRPGAPATSAGCSSSARQPAPPRGRGPREAPAASYTDCLWRPPSLTAIVVHRRGSCVWFLHSLPNGCWPELEPRLAQAAQESETLQAGILELEPLLTSHGFVVAAAQVGLSHGRSYSNCVLARGRIRLGLEVAYRHYLDVPRWGVDIAEYDRLDRRWVTHFALLKAIRHLDDAHLAALAARTEHAFAALAEDLRELIFPTLARSEAQLVAKIEAARGVDQIEAQAYLARLRKDRSGERPG